MRLIAEWFMEALLRCPRCWVKFGQLTCAVAGFLLVAGIRARKVTQKGDGLVDWAQVLDSLPVPTTALGLVGAGACLLAGVVFVLLGRWADKL